MKVQWNVNPSGHSRCSFVISEFSCVNKNKSVRKRWIVPIISLSKYNDIQNCMYTSGKQYRLTLIFLTNKNLNITTYNIIYGSRSIWIMHFYFWQDHREKWNKKVEIKKKNLIMSNLYQTRGRGHWY